MAVPGIVRPQVMKNIWPSFVMEQPLMLVVYYRNLHLDFSTLQ